MFYTPRGKLIAVEKGFDVPSYVLSHTMRGQVSTAGREAGGPGRTLSRRRRLNGLAVCVCVGRIHMLFAGLFVGLS